MSLAIRTLRELGRYLGVGYVLYCDSMTCELRDCAEPRGKGNRPRILVDRSLAGELMNKHVIGELREKRDVRRGYYKIGWMELGVPTPQPGGAYYLFVQ